MSAMDRKTPQQKMEAFLPSPIDNEPGAGRSGAANAFELRRPDRMSKSQLRAIHLLHENFVRSLVSDLSAYLRTYIVMNLVSVEQMSYAEFIEGLPPSTFLSCLGLKPYEGSAVLEINPAMVFPMIETLLGGNARTIWSIERDISEIEQQLMDSILRIVLRNLTEAWKSVTPIDFSVQGIKTDPQFLQVMPPAEAVVAIGIDVRLGESSGLMNIAMPSLMVLRQKLGQQWSTRKSASTPEEQSRILRLLGPAYVKAEARLTGTTIRLGELLKVQPGDVLGLDYPVSRAIDVNLNGQPYFTASVVRAGSKRAARIAGKHPSAGSVGAD
jgi:flagellar motor switch protein FliM